MRKAFRVSLSRYIFLITFPTTAWNQAKIELNIPTSEEETNSLSPIDYQELKSYMKAEVYQVSDYTSSINF